jgi:CRISPR-associated endonuclease/helicase Cas3
MNVLFVSQCSGAALTETRRILDQFSPRCGDRTWFTPITKIGLETAHRLLRKTARRNTAVSCYWIRQGGAADLLWIVGKLNEFNAEGHVPTNTTRRNIMKRNDENDWHSLMSIIAITRMAALFHDFGKSCDFFQMALTARDANKNPFRHEWVSVRLFQAFIAGDTDAVWLRRLSEISGETSVQTIESKILDRLQTDPIKDLSSSANPLESLPPVAKAVCWLILSHHRLPVDGRDVSRVPDRISHQWNQVPTAANEKDKAACFRFSKGLPVKSATWRKNAALAGKRLLAILPVIPEAPVLDSYLMHHARLCLMLADHIYSSGPAIGANGDPEYPLYANTCGPGVLKQRLDEHLVGVSGQVKRIAFSLPRLARDLPRLSRHKGFSKRTTERRFTWQNKAFDLSVGVRQKASNQGFFGVNMASTGTGKTLANARIMYGLGDPARGVRFTVALGLRSLTLQTGREYRRRFGLGDDALAIQVGGGIAIRTLFERNQDEDSTGRFEDADGYVCYDGIVPDASIYGWMLKHPDFNKLLSAPILVTTLDHLAPATESLRGGRQIAPMLRLANSDLILDEPDDFDVADLPALSRLVHWAGLLGCRVLLSSATLPPAIVEGLFNAYLAGRTAFGKHRGIPGAPGGVVCAWFDENERETSDHAGPESFSNAHAVFTGKRARHLAKDEVRRRARIIDFPESGSRVGPGAGDAAGLLAETIRKLLPQIHADNASKDPVTGVTVSFGLVRMANIEPLVAVARALLESPAPDGFRIHLCCYHARHPLIVRSGIEAMLDSCLDRKDPSAVFQNPQVRTALDAHREHHQVFLVLASPVAEVGRDHDYDWAIVEPSSMRSIIQLVGRIRRHRPEPWELENVYLLERNLKSLHAPGNPAFTKPGFEDKNFPLSSHSLRSLLRPDQIKPIDSRPRIIAPEVPQPSDNLSDLEHSRLAELMTSKELSKVLPVSLWWDTAAHLSGVLQTCQPFRKSDGEMLRYFLRPGEDPGDSLVFVHLDEDQEIETENLRHRFELNLAAGMSYWGMVDLEETLQSLAGELDLSVAEAARRFAWIDLRAAVHGWYHHEALGFWKYLD